MNDFSFNTSDNLLNLIKKIDEKRIKILTTAISPKDELRLRWEAHVDRINASFSLSGIEVTKSEISNLLTFGKNEKSTVKGQQIIDYKKGLDYITWNWLVSKKNISVRSLFNLAEILEKRSRFPAREDDVRNLLDFLQNSNDHPIVKSGISYVQFLIIGSNGFLSDKISRFLAYMFLYKSGYDFRGLLTIEESFKKDIQNYREMEQSTHETHNLTVWLEYYAQKLLEQLEEIQEDVETIHFHLDIPSRNFELNDRQREILSLLDMPDKNITNRDVQKQFKVSQITASRDLARLAAFGIIFAHGKGRSVYYSKV